MLNERNLTGSPEKQIVGEHIAHMVKKRDIVGLGTGSTVAYAIRELGKMVHEGFKILGIPTSYQSRYLAIECGIPLTTLDEHPLINIALDGADQVDKNLNVIKGGGAAHTLEKIIAASAKRFIIAVDEDKTTDQLNHAVPIEILPQALKLTISRIEKLGGKPAIRGAVRKDGPVITDNGNFIIDADFGIIESVDALATKLSCCTGVVEHGIFTCVKEVCIGKKDGSIETLRR